MSDLRAFSVGQPGAVFGGGYAAGAPSAAATKSGQRAGVVYGPPPQGPLPDRSQSVRRFGATAGLRATTLIAVPEDSAQVLDPAKYMQSSYTSDESDKLRALNSAISKIMEIRRGPALTPQQLVKLDSLERQKSEIIRAAAERRKASGS